MSQHEEPIVDRDAEIEMREMMGFSSFSTSQPKNQPITSSIHDDNQTISTSATPIITTTTDDTQQHNKTPSIHSDATTVTPAPATEKPAPVYAFVAPETGISFTREELNAWAKGKVDDMGDMMYFKPGFISEDPWFRLRDKVGQNNKLAQSPHARSGMGRGGGAGMNIGAKRQQWGKKANPRKRKDRDDDEGKAAAGGRQHGQQN